MNDDELFTPESVDEQVDHLSSPAQDQPWLLNARVVQRLHALYEGDQRSTARVWERLVQQVDVYGSDARQTTGSDHDARHTEPLDGLPQEEMQHVPTREHLSKPRTISWPATIATVLCTALLVGSLLWVLQSLHSSQTNRAQTSSAGMYINETDGLSKLDSQTHQVIWHTPIPQKSPNGILWPAPTVIGTTVYTSAFGPLLAFNAQTGAFLWSRSFNGAIIEAPTLADGQLSVITRSSAFVFYALNPTSGAIISTVTLSMIPLAWATGPQSPVVWDQVLYYTDPTRLYAVQLPSAKPLWQRQVVPPPTSAPPAPPSLLVGPISVSNGVVYVTTRAHYVFAFDARDGQPIWHSPDLGDTFLFLAFTNTMIYVVSQSLDIHAFDVHTHRLVWQKSLVIEGMDVLRGDDDIAVASNTLYVEIHSYPHSSNPQQEQRLTVIALNASNGQVRWQQQHSFLSTYTIQGSILGRDSDSLHIDDWNGPRGMLYALDPSNGSIRWQMPIGDRQAQWSITIVN
jgi:outer membrane protein assembly factor BamB